MYHQSQDSRGLIDNLHRDLACVGNNAPGVYALGMLIRQKPDLLGDIQDRGYTPFQFYSACWYSQEPTALALLKSHTTRKASSATYRLIAKKFHALAPPVPLTATRGNAIPNILDDAAYQHACELMIFYCMTGSEEAIKMILAAAGRDAVIALLEKLYKVPVFASLQRSIQVPKDTPITNTLVLGAYAREGGWEGAEALRKVRDSYKKIPLLKVFCEMEIHSMPFRNGVTKILKEQLAAEKATASSDGNAEEIAATEGSESDSEGDDDGDTTLPPIQPAAAAPIVLESAKAIGEDTASDAEEIAAIEDSESDDDDGDTTLPPTSQGALLSLRATGRGDCILEGVAKSK